MPYDEAKVRTTIEKLGEKRAQVDIQRKQIQQALAALHSIVDVETFVEDPDAPASNIGGPAMKRVMVKPVDREIGGEITDARRELIYSKRMTEANKLLA